MIFPQHFEQKTGFDRIRAELQQCCLGEAGKTQVQAMAFSADLPEIMKNLRAVAEFCTILYSGKTFPSQDYFDLRPVLKHLTIKGSVIEQEELSELRSSLRTIKAVQEFFDKTEPGLYPVLQEMVTPMRFDSFILVQADRILDEKGEIKDNASDTLLDIRQQQVRKKSLVEKRIRQVYLHLKKEGYTPDEAEITIRNGRSVIPLPASNKRIIRGFIHDESASGQTVYIEPEEIFEINNEVRELEAAERREIIRILAAFSDLLRPEIENLNSCYSILSTIDFTRAKAVFSVKIKAVLPKIENTPRMDFRRAINPNLYLKELQRGTKVIPLDIRLRPEERILIISGPNAGGKSVCLKTAGILQYMLQCGMLIPVRDDSEAGIFESIFIEIGDEQSIENDLSTYSSHLRNIRTLTEIVDESTLFLVDEFGSGTEPQMGGAIAEAVLEMLSETHAMGIVTTHYMNLKLMSGHIPGIINGAMLYDTKNMQPLYELLIGKPGSSFAFEIAEKTGLSKDILTKAAEKTGVSGMDFEQQLQDLETERRELEKRKQEFSLTDEVLSGLIQRYNDLNLKLEESRKQILDQARSEAAELLKRSNALIENAIRKIRESEAKKEVNIEVREELKEFAEKVILPFTEEITARRTSVASPKKPKAPKGPKPVIPKITIPVKVGGFAKIIGQTSIYDVEKITGKTATVSFENIRLKIPLDQLEGCAKDQSSRREHRARKTMADLSSQLNDKLASYKTTIDVRGRRAEETLGLIQKYIDDALLLNIFEVRILHGKGNGILRKIIREYLASIKEVKSFEDESMEAGGHGITVVHFR